MPLDHYRRPGGHLLPLRAASVQGHVGACASVCVVSLRAGATGLEPAASGVTGRRSNQLNYAPAWNHPVMGLPHRVWSSLERVPICQADTFPPFS